MGWLWMAVAYGRGMRLVSLTLASIVALTAVEPNPPSALAPLPLLPKPQPGLAHDISGMTMMAPGIRIAASGAVVLDGRITLDHGPVDGLEVLACLQGGKNHETLITLDTGSAEFVAAACKGALGLPDGQPPEAGERRPARGTPVRLVIQWEDPDHRGVWREIDGSSLLRDRFTDRPYPPLPFVYTGSRFLAVPMPGPDGTTVIRDQFMLSATRSVAVPFDEPDALLASPCPDGWRDHHYEVYSAIAPPQGTPVRMVLTRATLPLTIALGADGKLQREGTVLDDAALAALLAKYYGTDATPALRAVAVTVAPALSHDQDIATRTRILATAVRAQAWVVPVFVLR